MSRTTDHTAGYRNGFIAVDAPGRLLLSVWTPTYLPGIVPVADKASHAAAYASILRSGGGSCSRPTCRTRPDATISPSILANEHSNATQKARFFSVRFSQGPCLSVCLKPVKKTCDVERRRRNTLDQRKHSSRGDNHCQPVGCWTPRVTALECYLRAASENR